MLATRLSTPLSQSKQVKSDNKQMDLVDIADYMPNTYAKDATFVLFQKSFDATSEKDALLDSRFVLSTGSRKRDQKHLQKFHSGGVPSDLISCKSLKSNSDKGSASSGSLLRTKGNSFELSDTSRKFKVNP